MRRVNVETLTKRIIRTVLCALFGASCTPAYAYRPFDSTDASVAARGNFEIELGPWGYFVEAGDRFFVVPTTILNFGVTDRWEVVLEGRRFVRRDPLAGLRRATLTDTALSLKGVVRQGTLQDHGGPSLAIEVSILLPTIGAEPGVGARLVAIGSQRWSNVTVHVNGGVGVTRDHALGAFGSAIVEGPHRWVIRPVAEVVVERDVDQTIAVLVGAIWQAREHFSVDTGWRVARLENASAKEFRAGFTVAFPVR